MARSSPVTSSTADGERGSTLFVLGTQRSGKSTHLWERYTKHAPRKITIEVVDETLRKFDPRAIRVYGYDDTAEAMRAVADKERWHIVTSLDADDVDRLVWTLAPDLVRSRGAIGYARAVGGVVLACGELAAIAGNPLPKNSALKHAYLRFAHYWLSIYGATQHAPDCAPCTRTSVERMVFLRASDQLALDAVAAATTKEIAALVEQLPPYHSITCIKSLGRAFCLDEKFHLTRVLDYRGSVIEQAASTRGALAPLDPSADDSPSAASRSVPALSA